MITESELSLGFEGAVLKALRYYTRSNPISRNNLVFMVERMGFRASERQVREAIKQLRRQHHLICSMPGVDGGYYMAKTRAEYEEFRQVEFNAKITDMLETLRAMDAGAHSQFGEGMQMGLFK